MDEQSNFTLFFTNETYRWAMIELWKLKFYELPLIKYIIVWWQARRISKKMKNMTSWERYNELKRIEWQTERTSLINSLFRLGIAILVEAEEEFFQCKKSALENEYLNSKAELQETKAWLEQTTMNEANYEVIVSILEMLEDE